MNEVVHKHIFVVTVESVGTGEMLKLKYYKKIIPIPDLPIFQFPFKLNIIIQTTSSKQEMEAFDIILRTYVVAIVRNLGQMCSKKYIRQLAQALSKGTLIGVGCICR